MDKKERREQILAGAMEIFSKNGYRKTDVEEIAKLVGVGKGTMYRHFESKRALFLAVVEWGFDKIGERIFPRVKQTSSLIGKMEVALEEYLGFFEENKSFYRTLVLEGSEIIEAVGKKFQEKYMTHIHIFDKILEEAKAEGEIKNLPIESMIRGLTGLVNAIILKWLMSKESYELKDEIPVIKEIIFNGILVNRKS